MTAGITIAQLRKQLDYFASKHGEGLYVTLETWIPGSDTEMLCLPELTIEEIHYQDQSRKVLNIRAVKA